MKRNNYSDITATFDQLEMSVIHSAEVIVSYYKTLLESGIPEQLLYGMVMNFHHLYWIKNLDVDIE